MPDCPGLTLGALGTGLLLVWLVRGRLVESLRLGETLSATYENFYHQASEFLAGLKITKSHVAEDRHVLAFASANNEIRDNLLSHIRSRANAQVLQKIAGACTVAMFLWISSELLHMSIAKVLVLALIFYRLLPMVQALQQTVHELL